MDQCCEIDRSVTYAGQSICLDGRWSLSVEQCHDWRCDESDNEEEDSPYHERDMQDFKHYTGLYLYFRDLSGRQKTRRFEVEVEGDTNLKYTPINDNFGILREASNIFDNDFWPVELKWNLNGISFHPNYFTGESKLGDNCRVYDQSHHYWNVLIDQANPPTGNLNILFYAQDYSIHHYGYVDTEDLSYNKNGEPLDLPSHLFNCLHLNGNVLSGLSTSLDTISRYDIKNRCFLTKISITGLPQTIRFVDAEHEIEGDLDGQLRGAGTWSKDGKRLIVWSEEKMNLPMNATEKQNNEAIRSTLYCINLSTGLSSALNYTFNQPIGRLVTGKDGRLYVRNDEFLGRGAYHDRCGTYTLDQYTKDLTHWRYRHFRIPSNKPETLFFLSASTIPRPLSNFVKQIVDKSDELIPLKEYK